MATEQKAVITFIVIGYHTEINRYGHHGQEKIRDRSQFIQGQQPEQK